MPTPVSVVAGVDFGDADFAQRVRAGVIRIEELMKEELGRADELMSEAVHHLFLAGGKRFRPLFTVLSASLGPDPDSAQVTVAGAVIEMVHLATLYHDDVMDEAQVRRGAPSANARWSNNIAILAGGHPDVLARVHLQLDLVAVGQHHPAVAVGGVLVEAGVQHAVVGPQGAVLGQRAAGLSHEPHGNAFVGQAPARSEER